MGNLGIWAQRTKTYRQRAFSSYSGLYAGGDQRVAKKTPPVWQLKQTKGQLGHLGATDEKMPSEDIFQLQRAIRRDDQHVAKKSLRAVLRLYHR